MHPLGHPAVLNGEFEGRGAPVPLAYLSDGDKLLELDIPRDHIVMHVCRVQHDLHGPLRIQLRLRHPI